MNRYLSGVAAACCLALIHGLAQQPSPNDHPSSIMQRATLPELPGERADGSVLLPNQWSLRPVGRQVPLGDLPVNIAIHPSGQFAAVLHSGHARHQIVVVEIRTAKVVSRTQVPESFYGLEFSRNGARLFCSGAGDEVIHTFDFKDGKLAATFDIRLRDARQRGIPCGLAVSRDGRTLYAANVWGQLVSRIDLTQGIKTADIPVKGSGTNVLNS